jgi:DNA-binding FadR family transcriptional regulator
MVLADQGRASVPIEAVSIQRLYQRVAEQIARLIANGEYRPGERLPPERDLARQLGISRPTVREAMIALELAGLVEVRTGAGIYVNARPAEVRLPWLGLGDSGPGPIELIEARRAIEPAIAAAAATRAGADDIAAIRETLVQMEQSTDSLSFRDADRLFHQRIAHATGNGVFVSMVDSLWSQMFTPIFERLGRRTGLLPERRDMARSEHGRIVAAIAVRDPEAARNAMDAHLGTVQATLSGESAEPTVRELRVAEAGR